MKLPIRELKQAFELVDESVKDVMAQAEKNGRKCACGPNCPNCCKQPIPLTPAEIMLIMDYVKSQMSPDNKMEIMANLPDSQKNPFADPCPFLAHGSCSIYPVRPIACRRFLVSNKACAAGEDPCKTRPEDLIIPQTEDKNRALALLIPWHLSHMQDLGFSKPPKRSQLLNWLLGISTIIQAVNWKKFLSGN